MSQFLFRTFFLFSFLGLALPAFPQSGTLQFSQPLYTWSEANTFTAPNGVTYLSPNVVTVTRTGGSTGAVSANFCFWVGETTDNAVEGANYNMNANTRRWVAAGTLTWADGDASPKTVPFFYTAFPGSSFQEVRYSLKPSSLVHGTVTYSGRLVTVAGGATLGANDTARLEVTDAQAPAAGVINLSSRRFYGENGGSAVIYVRRDGGTAGSVSVNYATSSTLPALVSTTAQHNIPAGAAGTHYTPTNGTLTWADGDNSVKTFTIPLPATNYTNGTLHVAVNLSAPTNSAVIGTVPSALLTIQNKASTVFDINDNVDGSTFRVSLPPGPGPVRGILYWWPGTGGDDRHFTTDPNFRKIADLWGFAIASPRSNYSPSPLNAEFSYPVLGFLFDRLTQIAKTTGRSEILNAPFVHSGMSAGSLSSSSAIRIWPERTIAILGQEGWVSTFSPNTGNYVGFDALTKEIPCLAIAGQSDATQSPNTVFSALNEYRRGGVTRSAPLICWGRGHTFSNTGAAYNSIGLYWLDQVMSAGRYPASMAPTIDTAPVLGSLPISSGWWAARNCTNTSPYTLAGGSSSFLNIGPDATFTGIKDVTNALVDAWLPTESAARAFRGFVSTPTMSFNSPAQFASGLTTNAVSLTISENGLGTGVTKVEFFDGNTKIGEDTTSPYALSWTPSEPGARSLTAIAWKGATPSYTAFSLYLAFDPVAPSVTAGQKDRGVVNVPFAYQVAAGGPATSYAVASGSLPPGVTLNTSTGLLSGTPTAAGTFSPAITATNSKGTSDPVVVTLTIDATPGLIVHESFNYTIPSNAPLADGGLNGGNGLPATNVGGNPSGTSTGLRGTWGTSTDVADGLTYAQGQKTLVTSGGAARVNNNTWGTATPTVYRAMSADPYLSQRIGGSNSGNLGVDGTSLYVSLLGRTSSNINDAFALSFRFDGSNNFFLSNNSSGWSLNSTAATGAPLALNTTTLFVLRFDFGPGATDSMHLWVNPPLGQALGTPNVTVSSRDFPGIGNFQTRSAVANAMSFDELRIGTSLASVTPFIPTPTIPAAPSALSAAVVSTSQLDLTWNDNSTDETSFKLERSLDGSTGWTQIATPAADALSFSDNGLATGTTYHYRIRAANAGGNSAYSATVSATTLNGVQGFRAANGLAGDGSQDLLTPASDSVENLLKYAFNMIGSGTGQKVSLSLPNTSVLTSGGAAGLPLVGVGTGADVGKLQITYIRRKAAARPGVSYIVEFSDALTSWAPNGSAIETVTSLDANFERVTVTDSVAGDEKRFARVTVR
jgi:hypothetical protein